MKYNIAVLDDEKIYHNQIREKIADIGIKNLIDFDIIEFDCANDLIDSIYNKKIIFDVLLLDIHMKGINGMDAAKIIRQKSMDVNIIFITSLTDYVYDGYDVGASGYLLKPIDYAKMEKLLLELYNKRKKRVILVKRKGSMHKLKIDDIIYFESNNHNVKIVTTDDEIIIYKKLSDFYDISNSFIKPHKSYLINIIHIKAIVINNIELSKGYSVPLSRNNRAKVEKVFLNYLAGDI